MRICGGEIVDVEQKFWVLQCHIKGQFPERKIASGDRYFHPINSRMNSNLYEPRFEDHAI
jgi:hypothetical protein